MGEIYWREPPQNAMGQTGGERDGGQCGVMLLAEEHVSPGRQGQERQADKGSERAQCGE